MRKNKLIKYFFSTCMVMLLFASAFSCHNPTGPNDSLSLTLEDASCTEAWIKVTGETGSEVILNRDNKEVQKFMLTSSPQSVYDDSLLPNKAYTYQAVQNNVSSSKITVTTLDTTSSNFTWEVDTIGAQGSILYDVAAINDTLAYAVGELFPRDSSGKTNRGDLYNAARWNGKTWTMIKVPYNYQGSPVYNAILTVFALSTSDIYFGGNGLEHWDGKQFSNIEAVNPFWSGHLMQKIWASLDNNIYIVGDGGIVVHYNGSWQQVQTNTTLPFQDIWGDGGQVLAVASDKFGLGGKYLLSLNGNTAAVLNDSIPTAVSLSGIWFDENEKYFLVGDGVMTKQSLANKLWKYDYNHTAASYYSFAVRGEGLNNIVIAGGFGDVSFYNGIRWTEYKQLYNQIDQLRSVSIKGNTIIAAGIRTYNGLQYYGVVYIGRR